MAYYTDPTSRPVDPGVEQPDPRLQAYDQSGSFESEEGSTVETAKIEAANIKDTAADAVSGVKDVAKGEASYMADEARHQAMNLVDQTRSELRGQANKQQSQLAAKLNGWASELGSMASKADDSGPMTDLAHEASRRVGEFSHWLDNHEPADLLEEVKRFARRRPAAFLALTAAAGVVAGRLTRGAVAANTSVDSDTDVKPARAYDSDLQSDDAYGTRSYQSGGYDPRYGEVAGETSYQGGGMPPATDEPYYPPPVEGELRR